MSYAVVLEGVVINVVVWDGQEPFTPASGGEPMQLDDDSPVGIGWTRENGAWVAPPAPEEGP